MKTLLRKIQNFIRVCFYRGRARYCPICKNYSRKFLNHGVERRKDARCVSCGAVERHRLLWIFLKKKTDFFNNTLQSKMLHIAPEVIFAQRFKDQLGESYLSGDLNDDNAMEKMDITKIDYPDETFDIIYCSHVLEHVQNDLLAMRELFRVLSRDGWAILLVPIVAEKTFEDPAITDPEKRLSTYGHKDHVRNYGLDYVDRLISSGFKVKLYEVTDLVSVEDAKKMGLTSAAGEIYFCTK